MAENKIWPNFKILLKDFFKKDIQYFLEVGAIAAVVDLVWAVR